MSGGSGSQLEEVSPFSEVGGHYDFGFETVREDCPCFLRRTTVFEKFEVAVLSVFTGFFPKFITLCTLIEKQRFDYRNFSTEVIIRVVTISRTLLTIRCYSMPYNLVRHTTVAS